jgi:heme a synthase
VRAAQRSSSDGKGYWDNRGLSAFVLVLLACQYILGVVDVMLLAPVWLQVAHLLGADALWIGLVVLTARLTLEPVEQRVSGLAS